MLPLVMLSAAGCESLDRVEEPLVGDRLVAFPTPLVSVATKASESGYPEDCTFGVFGLYYQSGDFAGWESTSGSTVYIDGAEFRYDKDIDDSTEGSGAWISSPVYYWQKTGRMTFAAWSPFSVRDAVSYGADGLAVKDFSTGKDGQVDLMYSDRIYDKSSSIGSSAKYDGIDIVFHHALASLRFIAKAQDGASYNVRLDRVVLYGFGRQGTFKENISETVPKEYSSAPSWESLTDSYTQSDSLAVSGDSAFIIPQEITKEVKMRVYYSIQIGSATFVPTVSQDISLNGNKVAGTTDVIAEWEIGKRYTYNLTLGLQQIRFSVNVGNWHDTEEKTLGDS